VLKAVKQGHLATWPGLTEEAINTHLKLTPVTVMGHMNQKRQKIHSTSKAVAITSDLEDTTVTPAGNGDKTHFVYAAVIDQGQLYTDLTGRFPQLSSKGNCYVMVVYSFVCNYIKPVTMKSKSASEWLKSFGEIFEELTSRGFKPKLQIMDNAASAALKSYLIENDMTYQLVLQYCHRRNTAEHAIRNFPMHLCGRPGISRPRFPDAPLGSPSVSSTSRLQPQHSAAAHFHGQVDYNKTVSAPPGCKIIAHEKPSQRRTWAPHYQPGYSLGPAMHHYRCQNLYITSTASERIVDTLDTLEFSPHNSPMPKLSSVDRLIMAANDMADALKHPHQDVPFNIIGDDTTHSQEHGGELV
jgi:hypothetical protein